jgi:thiol-disulfide isomerase/thioredoxin
MMRRWRRIGVALALAAALLLTGCTEKVAQPGVGSMAGQGIDEWKHPTTAPVSFSGPTADGGTFRSSDHAGEVLVVNFWYAGCGPCIAEAPDLKKLAKGLAGSSVRFVGVNVRDEAAEAQRFDKQHAMPYPSIVDQADGGATQLAFAASIQPNAVPTTIVIGKRGRVTARVIGQINESVLATLIDDARTGRAA